MTEAASTSPNVGKLLPDYLQLSSPIAYWSIMMGLYCCVQISFKAYIYNTFETKFVPTFPMNILYNCILCTCCFRKSRSTWKWNSHVCDIGSTAHFSNFVLTTFSWTGL
jgi:hypothetical protein